MAESIEEDITRLLTNCVALSDYCSKYLCSLAYKRNMHLWYVGLVCYRSLHGMRLVGLPSLLHCSLTKEVWAGWWIGRVQLPAESTPTHGFFLWFWMYHKPEFGFLGHTFGSPYLKPFLGSRSGIHLGTTRGRDLGRLTRQSSQGLLSLIPRLSRREPGNEAKG